MFGGRSGLVRADLGQRDGGQSLNDTWIYDCTTRQWRQLKCDRRPPPQARPALFYDPASEQCLLVELQEGSRRFKIEQLVRIWSLDVETGQWALRHQQPWTGDVPRIAEQGSGGPKSRTPIFEAGYDPQQRTVVVFPTARKPEPRAAWLFRLDLDVLESKPAPRWTAPPPIKPQVIPAEDPQWVAKLRTLPANKWVRAEPPQGTSERGWGNIAHDPVRGLLFFMGGGHSSYQVNDVAIYAVGANRWVHAAGGHNDFIPPTMWGGVSMGYRGGKWAHHERNQYVAVDGRMFVDVDPAWFYDLDRGGVWRQRTVESRNVDMDAPEEVGVQVVSKEGRVMGLIGRNNVGRMANPFPDRSGFSSYDVYNNTLTVRNARPPFPEKNGEGRPLCYLPDRQQIFYYEHAGDNQELKHQGTWVYDIVSNRWIDLKPKTHPFNGPGGVYLAEYIPEQNAVFCVLRNRRAGKRIEYWVYSFEHNAWVRLAEEGERIGEPYGQAAYVPKYGVLVTARHRTRVMRPDFSKLDWP